MTAVRQNWPWWRWVLTGLISLALAVSAYLGWHYLAGANMIGCGGGSPCEQVLNSRWSSIAGFLPVSGLAAGAYLAMLVASFYLGPSTEAPVRRLAWRAMLVLVGAAAGSAVWFILLQKWEIKAFCPYCMTAHLTGLILAALVIWQAPRQIDNESTGAAAADSAKPRRVIDTSSAIGLVLAGVTIAGVMVVGQISFPPPVVYRAGESQKPELPTIDPHQVPLAGSPDAPYVVNLFFDYKCPHCQQVHVMLDEAMRRYGGKLAFAFCPAPLNPECNPYISRNAEEFADSCELAKIGLAVWVAKHEAFADFDRWMFSPESGHLWHPRSVEAATAKAVELVGQAKFDAARLDPWIDSYLQTSVQIFGGTGGSAVPKLVFGSHWVNPEPNDIDDLLTTIQKGLAIPAP